MNEAEFSTAIEDLLELTGWTWVHFRPARVTRNGKETYETAYSGHKGFFDYVAVKGTVFLIFELKSDKGRVSPEQEVWWRALINAGVKPRVWRPNDWPEIQRILTNEKI